MRSTVLIVSLSLALMLAGCASISPARDSSQLIGSGRLVTQTYPLRDFAGINAGSNFIVTLHPGADFAVSITADDNVIEHLSASVDGGALLLGMKAGEELGLTNVTMRADVSLPTLQAVTTAGNATVHLGEVTAGDLNLEGNSNGLIDGRVNARQLTAHADSNGQVKVAGGVDHLAVTGGGNAIIRLDDLISKTARVDLNSNAKATVRATEKLDYSVGGNAELIYGGGAELGEQKTGGNATARGR